jgi:hypothetical protein
VAAGTNSHETLHNDARLLWALTAPPVFAYRRKPSARLVDFWYRYHRNKTDRADVDVVLEPSAPARFRLCVEERVTAGSGWRASHRRAVNDDPYGAHKRAPDARELGAAANRGQLSDRQVSPAILFASSFGQRCAGAWWTGPQQQRDEDVDVEKVDHSLRVPFVKQPVHVFDGYGEPHRLVLEERASVLPTEYRRPPRAERYPRTSRRCPASGACSATRTASPSSSLIVVCMIPASRSASRRRLLPQNAILFRGWTDPVLPKFWVGATCNRR